MNLENRLKITSHKLVQYWHNVSYQKQQKKLRANLKLSPLKNQIEFSQSPEILTKILHQNIIPFWYPGVIDYEDGGYRLNHNTQGKVLGKSNKFLVTQARTVWFFSRLVNSNYGKNEYLTAAQHGYEFLCNSFWDKEFGGFYWEVDTTGKDVIKSKKHLYAQAFGIYALAEYALASNDPSAKILVQELFHLIESHAHDSQYGGYYESLERNWSLSPRESKDYINNMNPNLKTLNTHLHLIEAITPYYQLTKDSIARERLLELILIQSNTVLQKNVGACRDKYQLDWTPIAGSNIEQINYGHDLENIWLLQETCQVLGLPNAILLDFYKTLFSYALQYGFDYQKGGFYLFGYYNSPAHYRQKVWWVQGEALVSALSMYHLTGETIYRDCFCQTLQWIISHQIDWEKGDWYSEISPQGKPSGNKAGSWKSPYHNGRAMLKCLELLQYLNLKNL